MDLGNLATTNKGMSLLHDKNDDNDNTSVVTVVAKNSIKGECNISLVIPPNIFDIETVVSTSTSSKKNHWKKKHHHKKKHGKQTMHTTTTNNGNNNKQNSDRDHKPDLSYRNNNTDNCDTTNNTSNNNSNNKGDKGEMKKNASKFNDDQSPE